MGDAHAIATPVKVHPSFFPFLFWIALGAALGSTALTALCFAGMTIFASDVLKSTGWFPPIILGEIFGVLVVVPGALAVIRWRRSSIAGSILGVGLGLVAGNACAHFILYLFSSAATPAIH